MVGIFRPRPLYLYELYDMKWMMTYMKELEGAVLPGKPVEALSARRRILSGRPEV
jgi:hypothetical protein